MTEPTSINASPWAPLDLAVARVEVGTGEFAAIPTAAVDALVQGASGPRLAILAGMQGAGWSEIEDELARIYPGERGAARPEGRDSSRLVARWLVEQAASEDINGLRAIRMANDLWVTLDCPSGDLEELATFEFTLELVNEGVAEGTPASVVTDFVVACERVLAAGGPTIPD